jgi:trk system potassium uptake protein TrkA
MFSYTASSSRTRSAVIQGCGRIGASVAIALVERGYVVCVLDVDPAAFDLLPAGIVETGQILPIVGDGTLETDLRSASAQDADLFAALSGDDASNALAAQFVKHVLQVPRVICRINDPARNQMYQGLGLVTVNAADLVSELVIKAATD